MPVVANRYWGRREHRPTDLELITQTASRRIVSVSSGE